MFKYEFDMGSFSVVGKGEFPPIGRGKVSDKKKVIPFNLPKNWKVEKEWEKVIKGSVRN